MALIIKHSTKGTCRMTYGWAQRTAAQGTCCLCGAIRSQGHWIRSTQPHKDIHSTVQLGQDMLGPLMMETGPGPVEARRKTGPGPVEAGRRRSPAGKALMSSTASPPQVGKPHGTSPCSASSRSKAGKAHGTSPCSPRSPSIAGKAHGTSPCSPSSPIIAGKAQGTSPCSLSSPCIAGKVHGTSRGLPCSPGSPCRPLRPGRPGKARVTSPGKAHLVLEGPRAHPLAHPHLQLGLVTGPTLDLTCHIRNFQVVATLASVGSTWQRVELVAKDGHNNWPRHHSGNLNNGLKLLQPRRHRRRWHLVQLLALHLRPLLRPRLRLCIQCPRETHSH